MMTDTIRHYIRLVEAAEMPDMTPQDIARQKANLMPRLMSAMDGRSVAAVLEMPYDTDDDVLADAWFDTCLAVYKQLTQGGTAKVYRHMLVEDFQEFIQALEDGTGGLGEYWSYDYSIESPTWKQNQRGTIPVRIEGEIDLQQIDWLDTIHQNFQWPHEGEIIFQGDVLVRKIEEEDDFTSVKPNKKYPR